MVCEASLERIGGIELGFRKDASHIIAMARAFRAGVVNLCELLSTKGGFFRLMKSVFERVAEWEFGDGL